MRGRTYRAALGDVHLGYESERSEESSDGSSLNSFVVSDFSRSSGFSKSSESEASESFSSCSDWESKKRCGRHKGKGLLAKGKKRSEKVAKATGREAPQTIARRRRGRILIEDSE